ncbi:MAG: FtsW/RodA/SpoVE family cell cycle protein, partial [Armatimonadota bacterium]
VIYIMQSTEERLGRMISGGVLAVLLFHVFVNVGMTIGIMPVAGVPLPFFSYGPSNLLSMLTAMGLVMGVYTRRHRIAFGHQ